MPEAQILVAEHEGVIGIRAVGRAIFKVGRDLRSFGVKAVGRGATTVILDLADCQGMDSTFIGVLAMIGLESKGRADLVVVNASDALQQLLDGIGLSKIWRFAEETVPPGSWNGLCHAASGGSMGETVLAAHQALMELDPENVPKFRDVVDLLSAEVSSDTPEGE